jgi:hypothetical protein
MYWLRVPASVPPTQIEVPANIERSVKGSLHFRPNSTKQVTRDEWEFLLLKHSKFVEQLQVIQM